MDEQFKNMKIPWALQRELAKAQGRPSWESSNEGIHERVNFDDTIWGFNLAGGAFYKTPLRITQVKDNSRAEHAGIKVGDVLKSINDVPTSTLTVQQAHDMILSSGLEIKLQLCAPDVDETMHYVYQDDWEEELCEANRLRDLKRQQERKKFRGARVNASWDCAWPCNKKRDILYRESNCFLVPSKFEIKYPDRVENFIVKCANKNEPFTSNDKGDDLGVEDETKSDYCEQSEQQQDITEEEIKEYSGDMEHFEEQHLEQSRQLRTPDNMSDEDSIDIENKKEQNSKCNDNLIEEEIKEYSHIENFEEQHLEQSRQFRTPDNMSDADSILVETEERTRDFDDDIENNSEDESSIEFESHKDADNSDSAEEELKYIEKVNEEIDDKDYLDEEGILLQSLKHKEGSQFLDHEMLDEDIIAQVTKAIEKNK